MDFAKQGNGSACAVCVHPCPRVRGGEAGCWRGALLHLHAEACAGRWRRWAGARGLPGCRRGAGEGEGEPRLEQKEGAWEQRRMRFQRSRPGSVKLHFLSAALGGSGEKERGSPAGLRGGGLPPSPPFPSQSSPLNAAACWRRCPLRWPCLCFNKRADFHIPACACACASAGGCEMGRAGEKGTARLPSACLEARGKLAPGGGH